MTPKLYTISQLRGAWAAGRNSALEETPNKKASPKQVRTPKVEKPDPVVSPNADALIGKWFHSFRIDLKGNKQVQWQGQILSKVGDQYLIQYYGWIMGEVTNQGFVTGEELQDWHFYDTSEDMNYWYEQRWHASLLNEFK